MSKKQFVRDIIAVTKSNRNAVFNYITRKIHHLYNYQIPQNVVTYNEVVQRIARAIDESLMKVQAKSHTLDEIEKNIARDFTRQITKQENSYYSGSGTVDRIDSNEDQKTIDIAVEKMLSIQDLGVLCRKLNPSTGHIYHYLELDTSTCVEVTESNTKFKWLINWDAPTYQAGYINLCNRLGKIVAMRLGQSRFCNMWPTDIDKLLTDHIYFDIAEMNDQALLHPSGVKYHFIQRLGQLYDDWYGDTVRMSSFTQNRGWFRFNNPHYPINSITMTFNDITAGSFIPMRNAGHSLSALQTVNTLQFTIYGNVRDPIIISPADYKYLPIQYKDSSAGEYIKTGPGNITQPLVFSGFTTADPVTDAALIAAYNTTTTTSKVGDNSGDGYFNPPISRALIDAGTYGVTPVPITITTTLLPRWIATLEFVAERVDPLED